MTKTDKIHFHEKGDFYDDEGINTRKASQLTDICIYICIFKFEINA